MTGTSRYPGLAIRLALMVLFMAGTVAARGDVFLESSRPGVAVGDSLTLFCTVRAADSLVVENVRLPLDDPSYDVERRELIGSGNENGELMERYAFFIYAFVPDTLVVGPATVTFRDASGDTSSIRSAILMLPVFSALGNAEAQPMPNRAPFPISGSGFQPWLLLLVVIVVAVIAYLLLKKRRPRPRQQPVSTGPFDELAVFEQIRAMNLLKDGKVKELYFLLSIALRDFITRNMGFDAVFETTFEIERQFAGRSVDVATVRGLCDFLREADMVKFAKHSPSYNRMASAVDRALIPVKTILDARRSAAVPDGIHGESTPEDVVAPTASALKE